MLSLLLNKNPRLSLGVVGHRLLWSVAEVSRQERQLDGRKTTYGRIDGPDCNRGVTSC